MLYIGHVVIKLIVNYQLRVLIYVFLGRAVPLSPQYNC